MLKALNAGEYTIPTQPGVGVTVIAGASANTFGAFTELISATSAPIYVLGMQINMVASQYVAAQIGMGPAGFETPIGIKQFSLSSSGSVAVNPTEGRFYFLIPVPTGKRLAIQLAANSGGGTYNANIQVINQADIYDSMLDEQIGSHLIPGSLGSQLVTANLLAQELDLLHAHLDAVSETYGHGTLQAASATTATLDPTASDKPEAYLNRILYIVSGSGAGQATWIDSYPGPTRIAHHLGWRGSQPDSSSKYIIV